MLKSKKSKNNYLLLGIILLLIIPIALGISVKEKSSLLEVKDKEGKSISEIGLAIKGKNFNWDVEDEKWNWVTRQETRKIQVCIDWNKNGECIEEEIREGIDKYWIGTAKGKDIVAVQELKQRAFSNEYKLTYEITNVQKKAIDDLQVFFYFKGNNVDWVKSGKTKVAENKTLSKQDNNVLTVSPRIKFGGKYYFDAHDLTQNGFTFKGFYKEINDSISIDSEELVGLWFDYDDRSLKPREKVTIDPAIGDFNFNYMREFSFIWRAKNCTLTSDGNEFSANLANETDFNYFGENYNLNDCLYFGIERPNFKEDYDTGDGFGKFRDIQLSVGSNLLTPDTIIQLEITNSKNTESWIYVSDVNQYFSNTGMQTIPLHPNQLGYTDWRMRDLAKINNKQGWFARVRIVNETTAFGAPANVQNKVFGGSNIYLISSTTEIDPFEELWEDSNANGYGVINKIGSDQAGHAYELGAYIVLGDKYGTKSNFSLNRVSTRSKNDMSFFIRNANFTAIDSDFDIEMTDSVGGNPFQVSLVDGDSSINLTRTRWRQDGSRPSFYGEWINEDFLFVRFWRDFEWDMSKHELKDFLITIPNLFINLFGSSSFSDGKLKTTNQVRVVYADLTLENVEMLSLKTSNNIAFILQGGGKIKLKNCTTSDYGRIYFQTTASEFLDQKSFDITVLDGDGIALQGATVQLLDKNETLVIDETTDASGTIARQWVNYKTYSTAGNGVATTHSPHILKVYKEGDYNVVQIDNIDFNKAIDWTIMLGTSATAEEANLIMKIVGATEYARGETARVVSITKNKAGAFLLDNQVDCNISIFNPSNIWVSGGEMTYLSQGTLYYNYQFTQSDERGVWISSVDCNSNATDNNVAYDAHAFHLSPWIGVLLGETDENVAMYVDPEEQLQPTTILSILDSEYSIIGLIIGVALIIIWWVKFRNRGNGYGF